MQKASDCDCRISVDGKLIEYCTLHSAAADLVKAMRKAMKRLCDGDGSDSFFPDQDADAIKILDEAIAKTKPPKQAKPDWFA